jgi:glycosyltransferase involved in cell wall biosynthesis
MRVLAHIHTYNDADVIESALVAVAEQTRPPDAVVIVDNASTDGTLDRAFAPEISIIRNPENLGTSGAVRVGFQHALAHGFDWIWVLDADSAPERSALERLLSLYLDWPEKERQAIGFMSCLPYDRSDDHPLHGGLFTPFGRVAVEPPPQPRHYQFHVTNWSGCLYRLAAVDRIGLPNPDYVLDWGEYEYAYRVMKAGYKAYMHQDAVLYHQVRGVASLVPVVRKFGPLAFTFYELPPFRCYYTCRNPIYFALYDAAKGPFAFGRGAVWRVRPAPGRPGYLRGTGWRAILLMLNFLLRPRHHRDHILACCRGIWHGFSGNLAARY